MKIARRLFIGTALTALFAFGSAWSGAGHMTAASIAYGDLRPEVKKRADALLAGTSSDFVGASTWADETRTAANGPWHFINLHFRTDGKPSSLPPARENVVWAIRKFSGILTDPAATQSARTDALRYLIHFVADVHQPLHTVARDSDAHPQGDRGGNDFLLDLERESDHSRVNLHSYWDGGGGLFPNIKQPLDEAGEETIRLFGEKLVKEHPASAAQLAVRDPLAWAQEGLQIAQTTVYKIRENAVPTAAYVSECRRVSAERTVLAGKRLAILLNRLLG